MYPVTQTIIDGFKTASRQSLSILVNPVTGSSFELTSADVLTNGLTINRYSASGDSISLGSCVAADLNLRLENGDGRFNSVVFEGAQLKVSVGVQIGNNTSWIPLGYFTVDNAPRRLEIITITALDGMVQFDKEINLSALGLPCSISTLVRNIRNECNITLATDPDTLPNHAFVTPSEIDTENLTYRNLLQWACEIMGVCGYMDWNDHLVLSWYASTSPAITLTEADRYNSDLYENAVTITGIRVKGVENEALYGTNTYALNIEGNRLIAEGQEETIANGLSSLVNFTYHPFSASILPAPYLMPMDMLSFTYNSTTYTVAVTETNFTISAPLQLRGTGESAQTKSYARINPLTSRERAVIDTVKAEVNATLSKAVNNLTDFNQIISNALGLYHTNVSDGAGGFIKYLHDAPDLESSSYIVTETANGFAWTNDGWNGGSPVWTYGVTSGGYALFKWLSAEGIDVTKASSDYRAEVTPEHFNIYYKNDLIITIDATERAIKTPRIVIPYSSTSNNMLRVGQLVWMPTPNGANAVVLGS